jgi:hypothetical protein
MLWRYENLSSRVHIWYSYQFRPAVIYYSTKIVLSGNRQDDFFYFSAASRAALAMSGIIIPRGANR